MPNLTELRAEVAMRAEDTRIARKHRDEAGARPMTPANKRAYKAAAVWAVTCENREAEARARLIAATSERS